MRLSPNGPPPPSSPSWEAWKGPQKSVGKAGYWTANNDTQGGRNGTLRGTLAGTAGDPRDLSALMLESHYRTP